jgi:hypothetical protein
MALLTPAQWAKQQAGMPPEDKISYAEYVRIAGGTLEQLKTAEAAAATPASTSVSAAESAAAERAKAAADKKAADEAAAAQKTENDYYTKKVGTTGLTQAQIDAQANAKATAALIKGTVPTPTKVVGPDVSGKSAAQIEADRLAAVAKASQAEADRLAGLLKDEQGKQAAAAATLKAAQDAIAALNAAKIAATGPSGSGPSGSGPSGAVVKHPGYYTDPTSGLLYNDDVLVEGDYNGFRYKGGIVTGKTPFSSNSGDTPQITPLDTTAADLYKKYIADLAASKATADAALYTKREDAYQNLVKTFEAYNLGSLAPRIRDFINQGYGSDTISLLLQETPEYQARFAANETRKKNGLPVLSPAEYLATERSYTQIMSAAGLPKGFYDNKDDFTKFIAQDVSPSEIKARVDTAADAVANADPFYVSSLKSMYGLTTGDMIAHALDPQMALPLLQKQAAAAKIGTAAARQGWGINATAAENLYTQGVSQAQAEQGFRTVAGMQTAQQKLAEIWGGDTAAQGQNLVASTFGTAGAAYADQQIKALQAKEIGAFSGGSGVSKGSLGYGPEQTGGNL